MNTALTYKIRTARKSYRCDACEFIFDLEGDYSDLTYSEKKALVRARRNKYRIMKGDKYIYETGIYDGEFYTSRAIPEIHKICKRLRLYIEE